ncbi:MAG: hypothetical protein RLN75_04120, partial [Longimicrobiales bacterium]
MVAAATLVNDPRCSPNNAEAARGDRMGSAEGLSQDLFTSRQSRAEALLLELADYLYANSSLKPMSKALFAISRTMLALHAADGPDGVEVGDLPELYRRATERSSLGLEDDFDYAECLVDAGRAAKRLARDVGDVLRLTEGSDGLGLLFNTLVRGRWDAGEGLGTFLTPEVVVDAVCAMTLHVASN